MAYRIHLTSTSESISPQKSSLAWSSDELQTMEIFFSEHLFPFTHALHQSTASSSDPFSFSTFQTLNVAMVSFVRLLSWIHPQLLQDLVKVIKLEQVTRNLIL